MVTTLYIASKRPRNVLLARPFSQDSATTYNPAKQKPVLLRMTIHTMGES